MLCYEPNLSTARAWALAAPMARFLEGALVTSEFSSFEDAIAISATARLKASSFTAEGLANPLIFLTNCKAAAWISSSVAGGSKLYSTLMFLHTLFTSAIGYCRIGSGSRAHRVRNAGADLASLNRVEQGLYGFLIRLSITPFKKEFRLILAVPEKLFFSLPIIIPPNAGQGGIGTHILPQPAVIMGEITRKKEETTLF